MVYINTIAKGIAQRILTAFVLNEHALHFCIIQES